MRMLLRDTVLRTLLLCEDVAARNGAADAALCCCLPCCFGMLRLLTEIGLPASR